MHIPQVSNALFNKALEEGIQPRRAFLISKYLDPLFNVVLLETTNTCTRSCSFCLFGVEGHAPKKEMSWSALESIAQQLGKLNYSGRISPFGINEPLTDPRIFEIIQLFRQQVPRAFLSIISNGDLLKPEKLEKLWDAGLDAVGISVYDDATLDKLQWLGQYKNRVRFMDMRNPGEIIENRAGTLDWSKRDMSNKPCLRPQNMLVIRHTGKVALCCADMKADLEMGDVHTQSLTEIWYSPKFKQIRQQLQEHRRGLLCEGCDHSGMTSPLRAPLNLKPILFSPAESAAKV